MMSSPPKRRGRPTGAQKYLVGDTIGMFTITAQFKLYAHRAFNPFPRMEARLTLNAQSDARVLMEIILEKWYG